MLGGSRTAVTCRWDPGTAKKPVRNLRKTASTDDGAGSASVSAATVTLTVMCVLGMTSS